MSKHGAEWLIKKTEEGGDTSAGLNLLTVCNTGSLATSVSTCRTSNISVLIIMVRVMELLQASSHIYLKQEGQEKLISLKLHHIIKDLGMSDLSNLQYFAEIYAYYQIRLTAFELQALKAPSVMICDTMVGSLFQHHRIHGVGRCALETNNQENYIYRFDFLVVGADRIARNGDTANKVSRYFPFTPSLALIIVLDWNLQCCCACGSPQDTVYRRCAHQHG